MGGGWVTNLTPINITESIRAGYQLHNTCKKMNSNLNTEGKIFDTKILPGEVLAETPLLHYRYVICYRYVIFGGCLG